MGVMTRQELGALLNTLLEAERAGAKLLAAYLDELPLGSKLHAALQAMHESHLVNIRACEGLLSAPGTPAHAAASDVRH